MTTAQAAVLIVVLAFTLAWWHGRQGQGVGFHFNLFTRGYS